MDKLFKGQGVSYTIEKRQIVLNKVSARGKDVSEDMEEPVDTTPKATAIFWVDKDKDYQAKKKDGPLSLRTVKARVIGYSLHELF